MANINVDQLSSTIMNELEIYSKSVLEGMDEAGDKVSKEAVKQLRTTSPKKSGKYAKSWTVKKQKLYGKPTTYTIHAKAPHYRLAHLLEYGHAKAGGGRVSGKPHIRPVEEQVISDYMRAVEEAIGRE